MTNWTLTSIFQIPLVEYLQALSYPKKTNIQTLRKIDNIYLKVELNKQGGHVVMELKS